MKSLLLDTHTWAWTIYDSRRLSSTARAALDKAETIFVSPVSFFEIGQKTRLGKWPEMLPLLDELSPLLARQGGSIAALEPAICLNAATMAWEHRDPFDRLLAATALYYGLPFVSADLAFDGKVSRIW